MLKIYENNWNFGKLVEDEYSTSFNEFKSFEEIKIDYDVLIFDKKKYTNDDVLEYLKFCKLKPFNKDSKLVIINNFQEFDLKIQNKFLKNFEEDLYLQVLIVKNKKNLLPTILSRAEYSNKHEHKENLGLLKYPKRHQEILKFLIETEEEQDEFEKEDNIYEKYLQIYDFLMYDNFEDLYIFITRNFEELKPEKIYLVLEVGSKKNLNLKLEDLLVLQEKIRTHSNKLVHIEEFILKYV